MNTNTASVFNFTANKTFPQGDLYVDTNSWVDMASNRVHGQATEIYLLDFVKQEDDPLILWSPHSSHELLECIHVDEYVKEAHIRGMQGKRAWKNLENKISTNDAMGINNTVLQRHDNALALFDGSIYPIGQIDVEPTVRQIMKLYGVPYKDAKHLAYMWHEEVNNLLTNDERFTSVPGLNIFSANIKTNGNNILPISSFMPLLPTRLKK